MSTHSTTSKDPGWRTKSATSSDTDLTLSTELWELDKHGTLCIPEQEEPSESLAEPTLDNVVESPEEGDPTLALAAAFGLGSPPGIVAGFRGSLVSACDEGGLSWEAVEVEETAGPEGMGSGSESLSDRLCAGLLPVPVITDLKKYYIIYTHIYI